MAAVQPLSTGLGIQAVFAILLLFVLLVHSGEAIMCWECNSHYDKNCADPFRNETFALTDCNMRNLEHFPDKKAKVCRKIVQKVRDDYRFIRGCGWLESEKESTDCIKRAGTFNVLIQYCSCGKDGCNGALPIIPNWSGLFITIVLYRIASMLPSISIK